MAKNYKPSYRFRPIVRNSIKCKKCTKCGVEKEDTEFYWEIKGVSRRVQCKKCSLAVVKKYAATKEGKAIRKKHAGTEVGKATKKKADKKYAATEAGQAAGKKAGKKYAATEAGKASTKKRAKKYNGTAKGKANMARGNAKRRAKVEGTINDLTKKQWSQILKYQGYKCNGCKETFSEEKPAARDHIIPVTAGGGLIKENIQALCKSCNSTKGTRSMAFLINRLKEYHPTNCQYVLQGLGI